MKRWMYAAVWLLFLGLAPWGWAADVVAAKPPLEASRVALFAKTMDLAQAKTKAAFLVLQSGAAAPEGRESVMASLQALSLALKQGDHILKAEEEACGETGMAFEDFQEVRMRLIQVKMLELLEKNYGELLKSQVGSEAKKGALEQLDRELVRHEDRVKKSREALARAEASEAGHYAGLEEGIRKQKENVTRLETQVAEAPSDTDRERRGKSLEKARARLEKMEKERLAPYRPLVSARTRLEKEEKALALFRESMPAITAQILKIHDEVEEGQGKMAEGMRALLDADLMTQARLDRPAFAPFPDLKVYGIQK